MLKAPCEPRAAARRRPPAGEPVDAGEAGGGRASRARLGRTRPRRTQTPAAVPLTHDPRVPEREAARLGPHAQSVRAVADRYLGPQATGARVDGVDDGVVAPAQPQRRPVG